MTLRLQFHEPKPRASIRFSFQSIEQPMFTPTEPPAKSADKVFCPVCGATAVVEQCKVVCRSKLCTYRIVFNCSEF